MNIESISFPKPNVNQPTDKQSLKIDSIKLFVPNAPSDLGQVAFTQGSKPSFINRAYDSVKKLFGADRDPYEYLKQIAIEQGKPLIDVLNQFDVTATHELRATIAGFFPDFMAYQITPETPAGIVTTAASNFVGTMLPISGEFGAAAKAYEWAKTFEGESKSIKLLAKLGDFVNKHKVLKSAIAGTVIGSQSAFTSTLDQTNNFYMALSNAVKQGTIFGVGSMSYPLIAVLKSPFGRALLSILSVEGASAGIGELTGNPSNDITTLFTSHDEKAIVGALVNIGMLGFFGASAKEQFNPSEIYKNEIQKAYFGADKEEQLQTINTLKTYAEDMQKEPHDTVDQELNKVAVDTSKEVLNEKVKQTKAPTTEPVQPEVKPAPAIETPVSDEQVIADHIDNLNKEQQVTDIVASLDKPADVNEEPVKTTQSSDITAKQITLTEQEKKHIDDLLKSLFSKKITTEEAFKKLKPKAYLSKFLSTKDRKILTKQGDYSNAFWLLKPEYVVGKLKEKMQGAEKTNLDSASVWSTARNGAKPVGDVFGWTVAGNNKIVYVLKTADGKNIAVEKAYYDYLKKNIPYFRLEASGVDKPLIIYSGKKEAGLLMPIQGIENEKIVPFSYFTKIEENNTAQLYSGIPIKGMLEELKKNTVETGPQEAPWYYHIFTPQYLARMKGKTGEVFSKLLASYDKAKMNYTAVANDIIEKTYNKMGVLVRSKNRVADVAYKAIIRGDELQKDPLKLIETDEAYNKLGKEDKQAVQDVIHYHQRMMQMAGELARISAHKAIDNLRLPKRLSDEMKAAYDASFKKIPFYMHRHREVGNVVITVKNADGKLVDTQFVNSTLAAFTKGGRMRNTNLKKLEAIYPKDKGYKIEANLVDQSNKRVLKSDALDLLQWMTDTIDRTPDISDEVKQKLVESVINSLKGQGAASLSIHRGENIIINGEEHAVQGYSKDVLENDRVYLAKVVGFAIKQEIKNDVYDIGKTIPSNAPRLRKIFKNATDEMLRSRDFVDGWISHIRGFAFLSYMAGVIRAPIVNLTQIPIWNTAMLVKYGLNPAEAVTATHKALYDIIAGNLTEREKYLMQIAKSTGITEPQRVAFISGQTTKMAKESYQKVVEKLGWLFDKSEKIDRQVSFLSFIRTAGKQYDEASLMSGASTFVELANGRYGDTNLPAFMLGSGGLKQVLRTGYTFQSYNVAMVQNILEMAAKKEWKPMLTMLTMSIVVGGLGALPFAQSIEYVARHFFGVDPYEETKKYINKHIPVASTFIDGGLFGMLGINVSNNVAITSPAGDLQYSGGLADFTMNKLFGVSYAILKNEIKAIDYANKGNWLKALEHGIPMKMFAYPIKALREWSVGFSSSNDVIMKDPQTGKPLNLTAKEAILQAIGFTPERISEYYNLTQSYRSLSQYYLAKRNKLYTQYRDAMAVGDTAKMKKIYNDMVDYNKTIIKRHFEGIIPFAKVNRIKSSSLPMNLLRYYMDVSNVRR